MGRMQGSGRNRGFSLLELIVVVSIIMVLLGLLLPVLPRVVDASRRTACAANYHGIAQGFQMYRDQNKDTFPVARSIPPPWLSLDTDQPLRVAMESYVEGRDAWRCPGDSVVFDMPYVDEAGHDQICGMSYDYAADLSGLTHSQSFYAAFFRLQPAQTALSGDYDGGSHETQDGEVFQIEFFHERRNVLYADGHIE